MVEIRRIRKKVKEDEYSSLFYFPQDKFKYILIDEFQDFPNNIGYYIVNKHKNVIIFVDETQKIYDEGFTSWKEVLKEKFQPGLLNNYLRIVYRNPTDIYRCGLELLSQDRKLRGYTKVQEVIENSKPINEIGGLAFYTDNDIYRVINKIKYTTNEIKQNTGFIPKIGLLINGSEKDESKYRLKFLPYFGSLNFDVKSYLRVKGLEYDLVILKDFWDFLFYYKSNFSFLYRMVYTIISRGKLGVIIPYPQYTNDIELKKIYDILLKHSKNQTFDDLLNEISMNINRKLEENYHKNMFNIPVDLGKLSYKGIEIVANIMTILHGG